MGLLFPIKKSWFYLQLEFFAPIHDSKTVFKYEIQQKLQPLTYYKVSLVKSIYIILSWKHDFANFHWIPRSKVRLWFEVSNCWVKLRYCLTKFNANCLVKVLTQLLTSRLSCPWQQGELLSLCLAMVSRLVLPEAPQLP